MRQLPRPASFFPSGRRSGEPSTSRAAVLAAALIAPLRFLRAVIQEPFKLLCRADGVKRLAQPLVGRPAELTGLRDRDFAQEADPFLSGFGLQIGLSGL